ncbi:MAG TPA: SDR family oxidoreductase [Gammaproteobacteria bacterium]|jgi:3-oxoacyl-[acyl-carrier protein] reductase|nr:SDR family oxidoreductase [Gammaproteobacteria bacterium]
MDLGLQGKNAIVTGSSQGLGLAIATALAREGCNVALSARGNDKLAAAVKALQAHGGKIVGVVADLATEDGCRSFVESAAAQLGGIDILVNNVGGMVPGTLESMDADAWTRVLNLNLMAAVYTTKYAVPHLKKNRGGRILNVSGVSGKQLVPGALTTTIKNAGIIAFSKVMAGDLASSGITVNNICPGFTNVDSWGPRAEAMAKVRGVTPDQVRAGIANQTLLGRWAEPEEIGNVAAFLVSARNSYMTGTTVEVCGGFNRYI